VAGQPAEAEEHLRRAQALHAEGKIEAAINEARRALALDSDYVNALTYLGTTLVTRRLAYQEGLHLLERAAALAPDDAGVQYSLGWCYEFVAYRLQKQATRPYRDPLELYERAAERLRRCIALNPDEGLKEDAQDLLASIEARLQ
jgi:tetratricopeptide (TPR) repeat protein